MILIREYPNKHGHGMAIEPAMAETSAPPALPTGRVVAAQLPLEAMILVCWLAGARWLVYPAWRS